MNRYDFETLIDRKGKDALAIDGLGRGGFAPDLPKEGFDIIPMWVADMNFKTPACIVKAIQSRLEHPLFGYFEISDAYYQAIIRWQEMRNQVKDLLPGQIGYQNGVLGGLVSVLNAFLSPGDKVLVHNPTYVGFTGSITTAGYHIIHSSLRPDKDRVWRMDYEDMDRKIREHHIKAVVFCNPHNPCGRVWTREELEKAAQVFSDHDCIVIADEIWSDILLNGHRHIPFHTVSADAASRTVSLYSASKTFSLAGLVESYHIIRDPELRAKVELSSRKNHYNSINVLSMHALIGAYSAEGQEWVDELNQVLSKNISEACLFFSSRAPEISFFEPEGTYMLFLDCEQWCRRHEMDFPTLLRRGWEVGVAWQDGRPFARGSYIRMNLALPYSRVIEALHRLDQYVL